LICRVVPKPFPSVFLNLDINQFLLELTMKFVINTLIATAIGAASLSSAFAQTAVSNGYGVQIAPEQAQRTIRIDSKTRWVNVTHREDIRFVVGQGDESKVFAWRFDGAPQLPFKLNKIEPAAAAIGSQDITVYMARNIEMEGS